MYSSYVRDKEGMSANALPGLLGMDSTDNWTYEERLDKMDLIAHCWHRLFSTTIALGKSSWTTKSIKNSSFAYETEQTVGLHDSQPGMYLGEAALAPEIPFGGENFLYYDLMWKKLC